MSDCRIEVISEVCRVLTTEGQAILDCAGRFRNDAAGGQLKKALSILIQSLAKGGKVVVTGLGKSGKIGQKIAATMSSTGSMAVFLHPTEGLHGDLGILTGNDAVIALSHTGNTDEIVRLVPSLRDRGIPIIGIGGNSKSQLAMQCDAWLDASISQEACPHNLAPTTSTTLALAIGDALAVTLMQLRGFDADSFAKNHPGGSLGKRLSLKVSDLMHRENAAACVGPDSSMDEIIAVSSKKKLGAILVVDGTRLLGLITDGDIRRSLQYREKFFSFKASDVMTQNPISAKPGMLAWEALELMENRPSQISVLPVIDDQNNWLGIIRLHDLVRTF